MDGREQLGLLRGTGRCAPFSEKLAWAEIGPIRAEKIDILQLNLGTRCNLACAHCHVKAGPGGNKVMSREVLGRCLELARDGEVSVVDITGGAPELNPHLEWFLGEAGALGKRLIVRSNLVILLEEGFERFIEVYAKNRVEVVTSLPDWRAARADRQRGPGSFDRIIRAMRLLNDRGYGRESSGLALNVVHNPAGAYLPGPQIALEKEYRKRLLEDHGVVFNGLFCITNLPIGRFLEYLVRSDNLVDYMADLCGAFNPAAVDRVMCRTTLSVGWDGSLYDCDFNQALGLPVRNGMPGNVADFDPVRLREREIVIDNHCYGCVAGTGSSCQGATVE
jgi:radical SAM/Cys-rich protein